MTPLILHAAGASDRRLLFSRV